MFIGFDLESFLWGLSVSAIVGLFIRVYYMKKEAEGFPAWVELHGQFRGYGARIIMSRDPYGEYVRMKAPDDPKERIVLPISGSDMLPGAPRWEKVQGVHGGQIRLLGETYRILYQAPSGFVMEA